MQFWDFKVLWYVQEQAQDFMLVKRKILNWILYLKGEMKVETKKKGVMWTNYKSALPLHPANVEAWLYVQQVISHAIHVLK